MPAARWRNWYPHHIDRWRGSLVIQGMSDGAYRGYHTLLMSQWESEDGMLPQDDKMLARMSGLFTRWKQFRDEILDNFESVEDRIFNRVQSGENWFRALRKYLKRKGKSIQTQARLRTQSVLIQI